MSLPVLTAAGDAAWEAELTAGLARGEYDVHVARRCVDVADLLAAAAAGLGRAVVVAADLRRLDQAGLIGLAAARVAVVGLVPPADAAAAQRLRDLGVGEVLADDAAVAAVVAALHRAVGDLGQASPAPPLMPDPTTKEGPVRGPGRIVAVWGPAGAPGRSTVAITLAAELAGLGRGALLVDADTYGGAVGQLLGLIEDSPGLAAACRYAAAGELDAARLAGVAVEVRDGLRVLTGLGRVDRWPEVPAGALCGVLDRATSVADIIVVDCGFSLESDERGRNGATIAALAAADLVIGVSSADPVGIARYVRALPDCVTAAGRVPEVTVANRVRPGVVGRGDPRRRVAAALDRYAGIAAPVAVPEDRAALDVAIAAGRTLTEAAPKSAARVALRGLARQLVPAEQR